MRYHTLSAESGNTIMKFLEQYGMLIVIAVMLVLLYFVMIRPQRKQEKETAKMRSELKVGDEIVTIGGIVGIVISTNGKDAITIVSSRDRTRIQILRSAVSRVQVPAETPADNSAPKQDQ